MRRERALKIVLVLVGLAFSAGVPCDGVFMAPGSVDVYP
jgi:hypothetical protein